MKKYHILLLALSLAISALGQTTPVKIVFDVTSSDEATHQSAIRHVTMMSDAYPDSEFEVVIYGGALPMVTKGSSSIAEGIAKLENNDRVSIKVCEAAMKRHQINSSQLLPGVTTVPDGILEIVIKESEGWGYIKESHD